MALIFFSAFKHFCICERYFFSCRPMWSGRVAATSICQYSAHWKGKCDTHSQARLVTTRRCEMEYSEIHFVEKYIKHVTGTVYQLIDQVTRVPAIEVHVLQSTNIAYTKDIIQNYFPTHIMKEQTLNTIWYLFG